MSCTTGACLPRRCSGLPYLGADAGVYTVGALGKSQEKQVEQLTAGGPKMGWGLPAWAQGLLASMISALMCTEFLLEPVCA